MKPRYSFCMFVKMFLKNERFSTSQLESNNTFIKKLKTYIWRFLGILNILSVDCENKILNCTTLSEIFFFFGSKGKAKFSFVCRINTAIVLIAVSIHLTCSSGTNSRLYYLNTYNKPHFYKELQMKDKNKWSHS